MGPIASAVTESINIGFDENWADSLKRPPGVKVYDSPWWATVIESLRARDPALIDQSWAAIAMQRGKIAGWQTAFHGCYTGPFSDSEGAL